MKKILEKYLRVKKILEIESQTLIYQAKKNKMEVEMLTQILEIKKRLRDSYTCSRISV